MAVHSMNIVSGYSLKKQHQRVHKICHFNINKFCGGDIALSQTSRLVERDTPPHTSFCSLFFFTISCNQKCSVTLRMQQMRSMPEIQPRYHWRSSRCFPDHLIGWEREYPLLIPHFLDACDARLVFGT